ncbi:MAG TPA: HAD family phosphatase [Spirochaetia bacterium]|nr:HAD family phosphatase [Spirochaetia bacterium]
MKLTGVLFDMDGTLVDSEPIWFESDRRFVEYFGGSYDEPFRNECIGMGGKNFTILIKQKFGLTQSVDELLALKDRFYLEAAQGRIRAFPEMRKLVEGFAVEGMPMAVASGSSLEIIEAVLTETGLRGFFGRHLYSSDQVARSKPYPDLFLFAAEKLGVDPHDTLVFEDSQHGVEAGKAARMKVCGVPQVWTEKNAASLKKADLLFPRGMEEFTAEAVLEWIDSTYCQCGDCTLYELGRCSD